MTASPPPRQPPGWPLPDEAVAEALRRAFADGSWGKYHGPNCQQLSDLISQRHGGVHVVLTCSGTAAVELALRGLRIGPGDEVLLAAYDFEANFKNVLLVGARPVLLDIDPITGQLDTSQLEAARSPQTKAIIASHLHGGVVAMPVVRDFADQHGLKVIEDACQMTGATVQGRVAGTWGDIGVLSFGGSKLLTSGRGGALFTRDEQIVQRVRLHTQRGNDAYPLSELQAAVLIPQWEQLDGRNQQRTRNVARLLDLLSECSGLKSWVDVASRESQPAFYKVGFWFDAESFGASRDDFACRVRQAGVALDPGFRALHRTHARGRFRAVNDLPHATHADEATLVLHHPVLLGTDDDLQAIRDIVQAARERSGHHQSRDHHVRSDHQRDSQGVRGS
jgi:dTDP-4-amino-4,6-dideoxygalactose transaminase